MDIVVTTYPRHKSQNVGDHLITHSVLQMLKSRLPDFRPEIVFREKPLDGFTKKTRHNVIAPGFSLSNGTYPALFPLFAELERMENFFPVGCSFQNIKIGRDAFFETGYDAATIDFLRKINERHGAFPCRDMLIVERLRHFGFEAFYCGDMALFEEGMIGSEFTPPRRVETVAITLQHHVQYLEQSVQLMKSIRANFPEVRRFVSLHSKPGAMYKTLETRAKQLGCEILHLYGDVENLDRYASIDLHVGYRLHGHIHFLRKRKPSILLVEDARSWGFAHTPGTDVGCFDAFDAGAGEPNEFAPEKAVSFLSEQISCDFEGYRPVFEFIDRTYQSVVAPMMDRISEKLAPSR